MASSLPLQNRRNSTDSEIRLWSRLRARQLEGHYFRRQVPIGRYIVDFCCFKRNLIVELDGGQHSGSASDEDRTRWLQDRGFRQRRFWNHDILADTDAVLEVIARALREA